MAKAWRIFEGNGLDKAEAYVLRSIATLQEEVMRQDVLSPEGRRVYDLLMSKRDYSLPFHELFCMTDPGMLERYDQFYSALTLAKRELDEKTKELVWAAILIAAREAEGTLHLRRGLREGVTPEEYGEAVQLTALAEGSGALEFVRSHWEADYLNQPGTAALYADTLARAYAGSRLQPGARELILIGAYTALERPEGLALHIVRAKAAGVSDRAIAEAMSYVLIPKGANTLIRGVEVWMHLIKDGKVEPEPGLPGWRELTDTAGGAKA